MISQSTSLEARAGPGASTTGHNFVFGYLPNLAGSSILIAVFGTCLLIQIIQGVRYRTWFFSCGVSIGLSLEILSYVARLYMRFDPYNQAWFLMSNCCLILGPAFMAASLYFCLSKIVVVYGENLSRMPARNYTIIFICCDIVNLVLQGAGGGLASAAANVTLTNIGIYIVLAGLVSQVISLLAFMSLSASFARRVYKRRAELDIATRKFTRRLQWKTFLCGLTGAALGIFIRSAFRIAELSQGYSGPLANDEVLFMIFEGEMIAVASICLLIAHPGPATQKSKVRVLELPQPESRPGSSVASEKAGTCVRVVSAILEEE